MRPDDWAVVTKLPGNGNCIDCHAKYPEWGSVNFGILFCTRCCGGHRALGAHISRVRSVKMDNWTERQVMMMKVGGNQSFQEWLTYNDVSLSRSHKLKYENEVAKLYTEVLEARVDGRPEPKSFKEAQRVKQWEKPKEWYRFLIKGEESTSINQLRRSIVKRVSKVSSGPDIWLYGYAFVMVSWCILYIFWMYQSYSSNAK